MQEDGAVPYGGDTFSRAPVMSSVNIKSQYMIFSHSIHLKSALKDIKQDCVDE